MSEKYNVIYIIIDRLFKERYYILCHSNEKDISTKEVIKSILWNIYYLPKLLSFIISDCSSQFLFTLWWSMY